jgi:hypothetical protein
MGISSLLRTMAVCEISHSQNPITVDIVMAGYGVFLGKDNIGNLAAQVVGDQMLDNTERLAVLHTPS